MGRTNQQRFTPAGQCIPFPPPPMESEADVLSSHTVCYFGATKLYQATLRCNCDITVGVLHSEHVSFWKCRGIFRNWREVCCLLVPRRRPEPLLAPDLEMGYTDQQESIPALAAPVTYPGKLPFLQVCPPLSPPCQLCCTPPLPATPPRRRTMKRETPTSRSLILPPGHLALVCCYLTTPNSTPQLRLNYS